MKICIVGIGYVGLSLASLLSTKYEVVAYDIKLESIDKINKRITPLADKDIELYFKEKKLNLIATNDMEQAFKNSSYIIICLPTNFNDENNCFDTSAIEECVKNIKEINPTSTIIIKSTVPIGFTDKIKKEYKIKAVFCPEFSREGKALYDNLYPDRIIIGDKREKRFVNILLDCAKKKDIQVKYMNNKEAECVKLFSNSYLALRIAFFNELDTFAEINKLNTKNIIDGVCLDSRIGNFYNNPSFGYGGYCLPKDTKQLNTSFCNIHQHTIKAAIDSNVDRKKHIISMILKKKVKTVGIYKLCMKKNSDNFRNSAIIDIIELLKENNIEVLIFEPLLKQTKFNNCKITTNINNFEKNCDLIILNRIDEESKKFVKKTYTRDIFYRD